MIRNPLTKPAVLCSLCLALLVAPAATAQQSEFGTADEAKAMLMKVVDAVKADKFKAIEKINNNEFNDRDLYPFCRNLADSAGLTLANPNSNLPNSKLMKDYEGSQFGQQLHDAAKGAKEGEIRAVSHMFPRPGADPTPMPKVTLVTPIGDIYCGVGYYKPVNL